jgi:hypothetical protein
MSFPRLILAYPLFTLALVSAVFAADAGRFSPEQLPQYLKQYPDADANGDGTLSPEEARAHLQKMRGAKTERPAAKPERALPPTHANVSYGPDARNVLDFWEAKSYARAPVVVFIHGGGFTSGDKSKVGGAAVIQPYLDAGVSFAAINYRYRTSAPIQDVLRDCARAVQFIRSKADDWNVDKLRFAAYGGSAGAGTSLWLAFHDDLADPANPDPVLRESTRLVCAGANSTQVSYDLMRWAEVLGEEVTDKFGDEQDVLAFYGLKSPQELRGMTGAKLRADCDLLGLMSPDDPPVFLSTKLPAGPITTRGEFLHHPKHAQALYERGQAIGLTILADVPALNLKPPAEGPTQLRAFLLKYLNPATP